MPLFYVVTARDSKSMFGNGKVAPAERLDLLHERVRQAAKYVFTVQ